MTLASDSKHSYCLNKQTSIILYTSDYTPADYTHQIVHQRLHTSDYYTPNTNELHNSRLHTNRRYGAHNRAARLPDIAGGFVEGWTDYVIMYIIHEYRNDAGE